ncbi:MAG: HpcH/HpaI aldolase family protein [Spirochaetota bacterium]
MKADLKSRLSTGKTLIGSFVTIGSADTTEIMALAGYDFLVLDTEHGAMSIETVTQLIRAAEVHGVPSVVRVSEPSDSTILRSLDIGATGVQVPQVNSGQLARQIAQAAHYHPKGHRGLAMPRAAEYGSMVIEAYFQKSREETLVVAQCESAEGLEQLEAVASVSEVDVIFLGPFDLSHSLGIPGQVEDPRIKAAEKRVVEICEANGKAAGIFAVNGQAAAERAAQGFRYITIAMEAMFLSAAAKEALATARTNIQE